MSQVINTSPGVLLLITSRLAWPASLPALPGLQPGQSHGLQPLAFQAVQDLVRRLWPLKQAPMREDVSKIATACNGTPLLTRLVTPAFAYGRLSLQVCCATGVTESLIACCESAFCLHSHEIVELSFTAIKQNGSTVHSTPAACVPLLHVP